MPWREYMRGDGGIGGGSAGASCNFTSDGKTVFVEPNYRAEQRISLKALLYDHSKGSYLPESMKKAEKGVCRSVAAKLSKAFKKGILHHAELTLSFNSRVFLADIHYQMLTLVNTIIQSVDSTRTSFDLCDVEEYFSESLENIVAKLKSLSDNNLQVSNRESQKKLNLTQNQKQITSYFDKYVETAGLLAEAYVTLVSELEYAIDFSESDPLYTLLYHNLLVLCFTIY